MDALRSLGVGTALSAAVTAGVYILLNPTAALVVSVAAVYLAAGALGAYRPTVWRVKGSKWAALFTGVTTFGAIGFMNSIGPDPRFDVVVLGFGLAAFAFLCGAAMALDDMVGEPEPAAD